MSYLGICSKSILEEYFLFLNSIDTKKQSKIRCGAIIFNHNFHKVLLVKNKQCQKWGFPKGGVNMNETFYDCAIREVKEECGIDLKEKGKILNTVKIDDYFYLVAILEEKVKLKTEDENEICDVKFIPVNKIPKLYSNSNLKYFYQLYGQNTKRILNG